MAQNDRNGFAYSRTKGLQDVSNIYVSARARARAQKATGVDEVSQWRCEGA